MFGNAEYTYCLELRSANEYNNCFFWETIVQRRVGAPCFVGAISLRYPPCTRRVITISSVLNGEINPHDPVITACAFHTSRTPCCSSAPRRCNTPTARRVTIFGAKQAFWPRPYNRVRLPYNNGCLVLPRCPVAAT